MAPKKFTTQLLAKPNRKFKVDANTGHAFAIIMACVGALRPGGLRHQLP